MADYLTLLALCDEQQEEIQFLKAQVAELKEECDDYKATLIYCKHNSKGQGFRINGIFKKWSDD